MKRRFLPLTVLMLLLCFNSEVVWGQNDSDTLYDVYIGDIGFNESRDSITGDFITGHVSYNSDTHTLTLQDATVSGNIDFWRHFVKLKLIGDNYIDGLFIGPDSCAIIGPGYLRVGNDTVGTAINAERTTFLLLEGRATLDIVSNHLGINTYYDYVFDDYFHIPCFLIDSSSLTITAPTCYNLIDCWWLLGCHIVSPADVDYNPYNYSFEQDGTAITHLNNYLEIQANVTGLPIVSRPEVRVYGVSGGIRVCSDKKPDQNVEVMNMLGQTLYCRPLQSDEDFIPIRSGIYIVRVGKTTEKVIVR